MFRRESAWVALAAIVSLTILPATVRAQQEPSDSPQGTPAAGPQKIEMTVLGLSCPFCAYGLEKKLRKLEGVTALDIDFKSGRVEIALEDGSKASDERIRKLVKQAGFEIEGEIRRSPLTERAEPEGQGDGA